MAVNGGPRISDFPWPGLEGRGLGSPGHVLPPQGRVASLTQEMELSGRRGRPEDGSALCGKQEKLGGDLDKEPETWGGGGGVCPGSSRPPCQQQQPHQEKQEPWGCPA